MTSQLDQDPFAGIPETTQEPESSLGKRVVAAAILGGGAYATYRTGVGFDALDSILDASVVPGPPVFPEIVDGMVFVNEAIRTASPPLAASAIGYGLYSKIRARKDPRQAEIEEMSKLDYSDTDNIVRSSKTEGVVSKTYGKVARGLGVVILTALVAGGASGVEHEVSNGPNRPVERLFDELSDDSSERFIIMQDSEGTFMADSTLSREDLDELSERAASENVLVVPFKKGLQNIDGRSGLVIGLPDEIFVDYADTVFEQVDCENIPVVLDESNSTPIGETININGVNARVVTKISDTAQMNRDIAILPVSAMSECIEGGDDTVFGAVVSGEGAGEFLESYDETLPGEVITQEDFEANNRDFWRKNGTPILLQLMGYSVGIGAAAIYGQRKSRLQSNIREIGTMNATGVRARDIKSIETRRALKESGKAALIAAPLMPVMAAVFNAAEVGLKVGVGLREVAVGFALTATANISGTRRAVTQFFKNLKLSDAVKG